VPYVITLAALMLVVAIVSEPLRRRGPQDPSREARRREGAAVASRLELEAARDAKYREIQDAELDHRTGKLSEADYAAIDSTLRSEAIEILHRLDAVDGSSAAQLADAEEHDPTLGYHHDP
jgi:hypothetical protein